MTARNAIDSIAGGPAPDADSGFVRHVEIVLEPLRQHATVIVDDRIVYEGEDLAEARRLEVEWMARMFPGTAPER